MTRAPHCPLCRKSASQEYRPFCSARCREVDLGKWFVGGYAIPAAELDEEDGEAILRALDEGGDASV